MLQEERILHEYIIWNFVTPISNNLTYLFVALVSVFRSLSFFSVCASVNSSMGKPCDASVILQSFVPVSQHIASRAHYVPGVSPCIQLSIRVHQVYIQPRSELMSTAVKCCVAWGPQHPLSCPSWLIWVGSTLCPSLALSCWTCLHGLVRKMANWSLEKKQNKTKKQTENSTPEIKIKIQYNAKYYVRR